MSPRPLRFVLPLALVAATAAAAAPAPVLPAQAGPAQAGSAQAGPAQAGPADAGPVRLAPHRAVYDLTLVSSRGMRAVEGARGRILFDLTGNACQGYNLKFRQVTVLDSSESGSKTSDLRTTHFESGDGGSFRFRNDTSTDGNRALVDGTAEKRGGAALAVRLNAPRKQAVSLDPSAVFPNAQMRDLIAAAREGRTTVPTRLFDGSDDGRKIYETLAIIGRPIDEGVAPAEPAARQDGLARIRRWPVTISYFGPGRGDLLPVYRLGFELYDNGVSRDLRLDYGDFVLHGQLTRLDLLPRSATCTR